MVRMLKRVSNLDRKGVRKTTLVSDGSAVAVGNSKPSKNKAAVTLGKLGGRKGGLARAKKLTAAERSAIAKKAAKARWKTARKKRKTFGS